MFQAYQDRVKEEEQKEAETARLEEILTMCAEYERQISSGELVEIGVANRPVLSGYVLDFWNIIQ